jgi:plastocyanin
MKAARFAVAAGALLFVAMATSASAAVRPVDIVGFKFEPQSVTITAGDTVTWTNRDAAAHSARDGGDGHAARCGNASAHTSADAAPDNCVREHDQQAAFAMVRGGGGSRRGRH